jgi:phage gpG-like protein
VAKVTITDRDLGMKAVMRTLDQLRAEQPHVVVGITGKSGGKPHQGAVGATIVDIGAVHEFGAGNVPERSFLRATVDQHRDKYRKYLGSGVRREILDAAKTGATEGGTRTLKRLGLMAEGDIKKRIAEGIDPPLHPLTIKRKKSTKQLIDSGQLRASIASELRTGRTR